MKTPFYILGFLKRFGPQHGYQIKKNIAEHVADFTNIKLPTIYYHLQQMEKKGLIVAVGERGGKRPQRWVYTLTTTGEKALQKTLNSFLKKKYQAEFDWDGVLFFFDFYPDVNVIIDSLKSQRSGMEKVLLQLEDHREEVMAFLSAEQKRIVTLLFSHHEKHYRAELDWLDETLQTMKEITHE